jgi:hypothetical protein
MKSDIGRFLMAMCALVFMGCSSELPVGLPSTGGHLGNSQSAGGVGGDGNGATGGKSGDGGLGGTGGNAGTLASGGTTGTDGGTALGDAGSGGSPTGGAATRGGAGGGSAGAGGQSTPSVGGSAGQRADTGVSGDASVPSDAPPASDTGVCPVCGAMTCTYGRAVDSDGCVVCQCNLAPDGSVDTPLGPSCNIPEGCADAGSDSQPRGDTGASIDLHRADATGAKCGANVCAWGEHCCGIANPMCTPASQTCIQ